MKDVSSTMLINFKDCVLLLNVAILVDSLAPFKPSNTPTFVLDMCLLEEAWFRLRGRSVILFWKPLLSFLLVMSISHNIDKTIKCNQLVFRVIWIATSNCRTCYDGSNFYQ